MKAGKTLFRSTAAKLSLTNCPADRESFLYQHLFENTPGSLLYCLECLNDNSIVLREELTHGSISYVNLCMATINHCRHKQDINIVRLQPLTDYILAFWGSVFQHVTNIATLDMLLSASMWNTRSRVQGSTTRSAAWPRSGKVWIIVSGTLKTWWTGVAETGSGRYSPTGATTGRNFPTCLVR